MLWSAASWAQGGWYLLEPPAPKGARPPLGPRGPAWLPDGKAPLGKWNQVGAFSSADACEQGKQQRLARLEKGLVDAQKRGDEPFSIMLAVMSAALAGRCVASDDSRLQ